MKIRLTTITLFIFSFSFAQQRSFIVDLNAGARFGGTVSSFATVGPHIHADLGFGYMFTPVWGAKLDLGFDQFTAKGPSSSQSASIVRTDLQGIFSISGLIHDNKARWGLNLHAGAGIATLFGPQIPDSLATNEERFFFGQDDYISSIIGITPSFKFSRRFSVTADFSMVNLFLQSRYIDTYNLNFASASGVGTLFNASLGVQFRFGYPPEPYNNRAYNSKEFRKRKYINRKNRSSSKSNK
jgi:OOP family OmpA-OmpF porin